MGFNGDWCSRMFDAGKQEREKKQAKKAKKQKKKANKGKGKRRASYTVQLKLGESARSPLGKLLKCPGVKDWNGKNKVGCCGYESNRYKASSQPDITKQMMNLKFVIRNPALKAAQAKVDQLE